MKYFKNQVRMRECLKGQVHLIKAMKKSYIFNICRFGCGYKRAMAKKSVEIFQQ